MIGDYNKTGDNYVLPRDASELHRLNVQHTYLTRVACEHRIVFDKSIKLQESSRILDSGTGTGVWAIEIAKEVPESVEIHACDISGANFAPSSPHNVQFSIVSATSLPSSWTEGFDFIHQRFLFSALLAKDWPEAMSEFYRVLKADGSVQLVELDPTCPIPETRAVTQYRDLLIKMFDMFDLDLKISEHLPALLSASGFVDIVSERKMLPVGRLWGEIGEQGALSIGGAMRNTVEAVVHAKILASREEYEELVDRVHEEWDLHGTQYVCRVVCARKPQCS